MLRPILHKDGVEKIIEIWTEYAIFNATNQRLADQARIILKKVCFSDLEILENQELYEQALPIHTETLNTAKQVFSN